MNFHIYDVYFDHTFAGFALARSAELAVLYVAGAMAVNDTRHHAVAR